MRMGWGEMSHDRIDSLGGQESACDGRLALSGLRRSVSPLASVNVACYGRAFNGAEPPKKK